MKKDGKQDILAELERRLSTFSKGQRTLARYILGNYDKAAFMTAARLGETVGVSESTVVRFAAELGYRGYPGMKKALQEVVRSRLTSAERLEEAKGAVDAPEALRAVLHADINNLQTTLDGISPADFQAAVDMILAARRVYILGLGTAAAPARALGQYLVPLRDGVRVVRCGAADALCEQLLRVGAGDLVIALSFPRHTRAAVSAVRLARDRGAAILTLTDGKAAPLQALADTRLYARGEMVSFLDSLAAPMSLASALAVAVGMRDRESTRQSMRTLESIRRAYEEYQTNEG